MNNETLVIRVFSSTVSNNSHSLLKELKSISFATCDEEKIK